MDARKYFFASVLLLVPFAALAAEPIEPVIIASDITTEWFDTTTNTWKPAVRALPHPSWPPLSGSHWIWNMRSASDQQRREGATIQFRYRFNLPENRTGTLTIMADNEVTASLNGTEISHTTCDFTDAPSCMKTFPVEGKSGDNEFTFTVINWPKPGASSTQNPAGFIYQATFDQIVTPPEREKPDPIVLVPGMTASLDVSTIFADGNNAKWRFAPGAQAFYQALIDRLEESGFTENQNLFIAHYDWRSPINDSATNYLKPVIEQAKQSTGSDKVDIVAHSMGGLVSRAYIQGAHYEEDVDQLITLGTPHLGASDAYVAWEGGEFPERWDLKIRWYIRAVENSLKFFRGPVTSRPATFRTYFPSLKDLIPINNFVIRNDADFPISQHAEQNAFLQELRNTADILLNNPDGPELTTIAGTEQVTLNSIKLDGTRTSEDVAKDRWRDGHPNPDPPVTDFKGGDRTVLLSSALLGSNTITKANTAHDKLPEEAQEEVLQALDLDFSGQYLAYDTPSSLVGTIVLSPVTPSITFPNGTTFTCDVNKQTGNAECVVDETDPNGPKLLVISDPEVGTYTTAFAGTGEGEYHAITCFADADDDSCTTREATTTPGEIDISQFLIGEETFTPPPGDTLALLQQLKDTVHQLLLDKHLDPQAQRLHGLAASLADHGQEYVEAVQTFGLTSPEAQELYQKIQKDFARFSSELEKQIAAGNLDETAILEITSLRDQLESAGL